MGGRDERCFWSQMLRIKDTWGTRGSSLALTRFIEATDKRGGSGRWKLQVFWEHFFFSFSLWASANAENSHSLNSSTEASDCSLRTLQNCVKQRASLILHYTLNALKKKGEKQQQLSGKGTVILPKRKKKNKKKKKTDTRNNYCYRCFRLAEMKQERWWGICLDWRIKGRKTNRTFAKNIFVFVPLKRCQSWSRWYNKENDTTIV